MICCDSCERWLHFTCAGFTFVPDKNDLLVSCITCAGECLIAQTALPDYDEEDNGVSEEYEDLQDDSDEDYAGAQRKKSKVLAEPASEQHAALLMLVASSQIKLHLQTTRDAINTEMRKEVRAISVLDVAKNLIEFNEKAVIGIQSAAGYAEGRPLFTSWKN